jgi:hypothetical protein
MSALRWSVIAVVAAMILGIAVLAAGVPEHAARYYWRHIASQQPGVK